MEAKLKKVEVSDSRRLFSWRNKKFIRENSLNKKKIEEKTYIKGQVFYTDDETCILKSNQKPLNGFFTLSETLISPLIFPPSFI